MTTRNWTREIDDDYAGREEKQERQGDGAVG